MQPTWRERPLSANALDVFVSCPLRFRLRYIEGLFPAVPRAAAPEEREALALGEGFHLLARRYYAGLDPAPGTEEPELVSWLARLQAFLPRSFDGRFYPELELRLLQPDLRLTATFDLLVVDPDGRATIFDWKTERRPPSRRLFRNSTQTLVYRYMLCAAGGAYSPLGRFAPEQVSMVYWNPHFPGRSVRLDYSEAEYRRDEERLRELAARIHGGSPESFGPALNPARCARCEFQAVCRTAARA